MCNYEITLSAYNTYSNDDRGLSFHCYVSFMKNMWGNKQEDSIQNNIRLIAQQMVVKLF